MSLKSTAKGYHRLLVNGVFFSQHSSLVEALVERASAILQADPSLIVTVYPPVYEVRASDATVVVPPTEPVTSDGGEDLIDFIERIGPAPIVNETYQAASILAGVDAFLDRSRTTWLVNRCYWDPNDGTPKILVAYGWRGYGLLVHKRVKGTIKIGG